MKLPQGFRAGAVAAGLKSSGALDLTIIENQGPRFNAVAVFTTNKVVAAPVIWSKEVAKGGLVRAVVLNSGAQMPVPVRRALSTHMRQLNWLAISYQSLPEKSLSAQRD